MHPCFSPCPNDTSHTSQKNFGVPQFQVKSQAASHKSHMHRSLPAASGSPAVLVEDALGQKCDLLSMTYDANMVHYGKPVANCFTDQFLPLFLHQKKIAYCIMAYDGLEYLQTLDLKRSEPIAGVVQSPGLTQNLSPSH
jgi:hypothetical protein